MVEGIFLFFGYWGQRRLMLILQSCGVGILLVVHRWKWIDWLIVLTAALILHDVSSLLGKVWLICWLLVFFLKLRRCFGFYLRVLINMQMTLALIDLALLWAVSYSIITETKWLQLDSQLAASWLSPRIVKLVPRHLLITLLVFATAARAWPHTASYVMQVLIDECRGINLSWTVLARCLESMFGVFDWIHCADNCGHDGVDFGGRVLDRAACFLSVDSWKQLLLPTRHLPLRIVNRLSFQKRFKLVKSFDVAFEVSLAAP